MSTFPQETRHALKLSALQSIMLSFIIPFLKCKLNQVGQGSFYLHDGRAANLVGGFNPFEPEFSSNWIISPMFGMNIKNIWVATTQ